MTRPPSQGPRSARCLRPLGWAPPRRTTAPPSGGPGRPAGSRGSSDSGDAPPRGTCEGSRFMGGTTVQLVAGSVVIAGAVVAVLRKVDVRLALLPAALVLGALAGPAKLLGVVHTFFVG